MDGRLRIKKPKLPDYQKSFLYSQKRFTVVEASTKTGKTFSHLYWIFEISHGKNPVWYTGAVKPGWEFWWVAPIYSQAEIAFNRLKSKVIFAGYQVNESKLFIKTPLGTIIRFKSADKPDNLYGEDVYAVVFDEFTRAKETAWHAIRTTLTATGGPCKFIGNYTGTSNWGHKLGKKAGTDPNEYDYFRVTAHQAAKAGILDYDEIDQARKDLPQQVFEALYLATGSLADDVLFAPDDLESAFYNEHLQGGRDRYISADIALHGSDRFVVCVWDDWTLIKVIAFDKIEPDEVTAKLKGFAAEYQVPRKNIVYDGDGLGAYLRGYLKSAIPFLNGSKPVGKINYYNLKSQCFFRLAKRVKDGDIFISHHEYKEKIIAELEQVKKYNPDGETPFRVTPKKLIKEAIGHSPDFADAIMMRDYLQLRKEGALRFG